MDRNIKLSNWSAISYLLTKKYCTNSPIDSYLLTSLISQAKPPPVTLLYKVFRFLSAHQKWKALKQGKEVMERRKLKEGMQYGEDVEKFFRMEPEVLVKYLAKIQSKINGSLDNWDPSEYESIPRSLGPLDTPNSHDILVRVLGNLGHSGHSLAELFYYCLSGTRSRPQNIRRAVVLAVVMNEKSKKALKDNESLLRMLQDSLEDEEVIAFNEDFILKMDYEQMVQDVHPIISSDFMSKIFEFKVKNIKTQGSEHMDSINLDTGVSDFTVANLQLNEVFYKKVPFAVITHMLFDCVATLHEHLSSLATPQKLASEILKDLLEGPKKVFDSVSECEDFLKKPQNAETFWNAMSNIRNAITFADRLANLEQSSPLFQASNSNSLAEYAKFPDQMEVVEEHRGHITDAINDLRNLYLDYCTVTNNEREERSLERGRKLFSHHDIKNHRKDATVRHFEQNTVTVTSHKAKESLNSQDDLWNKAISGAAGITLRKKFITECEQDRDAVKKESRGMASLLEVSKDCLLKDKELGLMDQDEAIQIMDDIEAEKEEFYNNKNQVCTRSDEEIIRYQQEIEAEEKKQQEDREVLGYEIERNRILAERDILTFNVEEELRLIREEWAETKPENERRRDNARTQLDQTLKEQRIRDKHLYKELEKQLVEHAATDLPSFLASNKKVTSGLTDIIQEHEAIFAHATKEKEDCENAVNNLLEEVEIMNSVFEKAQQKFFATQEMLDNCDKSDFTLLCEVTQAHLESEKELSEANYEKIVSEYDLEEAQRDSFAAYARFNLVAEFHKVQERKALNFVKAQANLERFVKRTQEQRETIKYTLDKEMLQFQRERKKLIKNIHTERTEEAKKLYGQLQLLDESDEGVLDELLRSKAGHDVIPSLYDLQEFLEEAEAVTVRFANSVEKFNMFMVGIQEEKDKSAEEFDLLGLKREAMRRDEVLHLCQGGTEIAKKNMLQVCKDATDDDKIVPYSNAMLKLEEDRVDAEVAKLQADRTLNAAESLVDFLAQKHRFISLYYQSAIEHQHAVTKLVHDTEQLIDDTRTRNKKDKVSLEIDRHRERLISENYEKNAKRQAKREEDRQAHIDKLYDLELEYEAVFKELDDEVAEVASPDGKRKCSNDFKSFVSVAEDAALKKKALTDKANAMIELSCAVRDDAKAEVDRITKEVTKLGVELKKATHTLDMREKAATRSAQVVAASAKMQQAERRNRISEDLISATKEKGFIEAKVHAEKKDLEQAKMDYKYALEGLHLAEIFHKRFTKRSDEFRKTKVKMAQEIENIHMRSELDRIKIKVKKDKDRASTISIERKAASKKAREEAAKELAEQAKVQEEDEEVFAEVEKFIKDNWVEDINKFLESEHEIAIEYRMVIQKYDGAVLTATEARDEARAEVAALKKEVAKLTTDLTKVEALATRKQEALRNRNPSRRDSDERVGDMKELLTAEEEKGAAELAKVEAECRLEEATDKLSHVAEMQEHYKGSVQSAKRLRIQELAKREQSSRIREIESIKTAHVSGDLEVLAPGEHLVCDSSLYALPITPSALDLVEEALAMGNGYVAEGLVCFINNTPVSKANGKVNVALKIDEDGRQLLLLSARPNYKSRGGGAAFGETKVEVQLDGKTISIITIETIPADDFLLPNKFLFTDGISGRQLSPQKVECTYPDGSTADISDTLEAGILQLEGIEAMPDGPVRLFVNEDGYKEREIFFWKHKSIGCSIRDMQIMLVPDFTENQTFDPRHYTGHKFMLSWGSGQANLSIHVVRSDGEEVGLDNMTSSTRAGGATRNRGASMQVKRGAASDSVEVQAKIGTEYIVYVKSKGLSSSLSSSHAVVQHTLADGRDPDSYRVPHECCDERMKYWWVAKIYTDGEVVALDQLDDGMPVFHGGKLSNGV
ncbi:hypothetical protein TrST_g12853 [Triparma strigata]|uniref:Uncharacterized protein n=1 Tax=Triparma strigata TaxID=1606541 RepID=A0A9W7EZE7_9STRA|nr:hypothetical protein TrST_g12853 [Triparma strigata]